MRVGRLKKARDSVGMNLHSEIKISARRFELTDAIREKVGDIARKLRGHDGSIWEMRFELEMEPHAVTRSDEFVAKGHVEDGRDRFLATAEGDNLYSVLGDLEQKLDKLIRRSHRRRLSERRRPHPIELDADLPKISPVSL